MKENENKVEKTEIIARKRKTPMSAKAWFILFSASVLTVALIICAVNITVDPFGVFGDKFFNWYSFDMTQNPKAAKLAYIDENHEKYNAYILGASNSSSFSPDALDKYTGKKWYNMFNYGADMSYTLKLAEWLTDNCEVEEIFLSLPFISAAQYNMPIESMNYEYPPQIGGKLNWLKFLFANPRFSINKISDYKNKGYLQQSFNVFLPENGVYDKSTRDAEPIGALDEYLEKYPEFVTYSKQVSLSFIDECMTSVKNLSELCKTRDIKLTIVIPPMLAAGLDAYDAAELDLFRARLGEICDYYDYSDFSTDEPRYFYDPEHFRNALGDMVLADIYGDDGYYRPRSPNERDRELTALVYHDIVEKDADNSGSTILADFINDMETLKKEGYTPVSVKEAADYVNKGSELPSKPVIICFEDGYLDNYLLAYPVLKKYGYKAVMFVIGVSVGSTERYKDYDFPITPHFSFEQAREMINGGLIEIESHTYDMHQIEEYDGDNCRKGVLQMPGESENDYAAALKNDYTKSSSEIESALKTPVEALAYPYGLHGKISDVVFAKLGVKMTITTEEGKNTILKGLPQSLYNLKIQFKP